MKKFIKKIVVKLSLYFDIPPSIEIKIKETEVSVHITGIIRNYKGKSVLDFEHNSGCADVIINEIISRDDNKKNDNINL